MKDVKLVDTMAAMKAARMDNEWALIAVEKKDYL